MPDREKRNVPENIYACSLVRQLLKKQSSLLLNRLVVDVCEQKGYCVTRINFLKQGITQNDRVQTTLFMLLTAILVFKDRGSHSSTSLLPRFAIICPKKYTLHPNRGNIYRE